MICFNIHKAYDVHVYIYIYVYIVYTYFLCFLLGFVPIISYELAEHNPKTSKKHVKKEPATKIKKSTNKKKQGNTYLG